MKDLFDCSLQLASPRLILRPLNEKDAAAIYEAVMESWDSLSRFNIWILNEREKISCEDYAKFCRRKRELMQASEDMTMSIWERKTGRFLGACGLHKPDWVNRTFTIGFWIRSSEQRKGYATEGVMTLKQYAFKELNATVVKSFHEEGNDASGAVLEKAGFCQLDDFETLGHSTRESFVEYKCSLADYIVNL